MSEAQVIARIDALEAAVQRMANSLAVKADRTNVVLDKNNPNGLQAAVQTMANALAQQHTEQADEGAYIAGMVFDTMMSVGYLIQKLAPYEFNVGDGAMGAGGGGEGA